MSAKVESCTLGAITVITSPETKEVPLDIKDAVLLDAANLIVAIEVPFFVTVKSA